MGEWGPAGGTLWAGVKPAGPAPGDGVPAASRQTLDVVVRVTVKEQ